MKFVSAASDGDPLGEVVRAFESTALAELEEAPDLALLFYTAEWAERAADLGALVRESLTPRVLIGVSAEGVIGGDREIERAPGVALLAATLPGVTLQPFHIGVSEWRSLLPNDERFQQRLGTGDQHRAQLLFGDPFTTPVDQLLDRCDTLLRAPTMGGMASAARAPDGNRLLLDDQAYRDGIVGVGLGGDLRVETVVSQGCRPVGKPLVITKVEDDFILELGRRPALEVAQGVLDGLKPAELALIQSGGLFVGVVINEYQSQFGRGDFLVRGLLGVDPSVGGLAIGDHVRAGQTIQFHVRDAETATEDLRALLAGQPDRSPAGALMVSCNGRGRRLFPNAAHELGIAHQQFPSLPTAGFFAMGELGPIGGKCFIHGHTASVALFYPG